MTKEEFEVNIYPILAKYQIENSALVSEDIWQVFKPEQDRILKIVTDYAVRSSPTDENVRARKIQLESDFQKMKDGMNGEIEKLRIEVSNLNVEIARLKEMAEAAKKQARPLLNVLNDKITELEDYIFTGHAKGRRIKEAIRQRNMIKDISNFNDAK